MSSTPPPAKTDEHAPRTILDTLRTQIKLQKFKHGQLEAITAILQAQDTCIFWATGSGKSLCFQLPAIHCQKLVLIVSPLLSLINDQIKNINLRFGRDLAVSFASTNATPKIMDKIQSGESLLCYCTPERLNTPEFLEHMAEIHNNTRSIMLLAVDEAHMISQQGFEFRPSYRNISAFRQRFPDIPISALTATAPPHIRKDLMDNLKLKNPQVFTSSYDKPNLRVKVVMQDKKTSFHEIARACDEPSEGRTIVFTYTRTDAEKLHEYITTKGKTKSTQSAMLYHGQVQYEHREKVQKWFNEGAISIVIATGSSFGTGVDVGDIRRVFICGLPKTFEDYYQQIGRAGRDGKKSDVSMYVASNDHMVHLFRNKATDKTHLAMANNEKKSLFSLLSYCRDYTTCRRKMILKYWGQGNSDYACGECDNCQRPAGFSPPSTAKSTKVSSYPSRKFSKNSSAKTNGQHNKKHDDF